VLIADNFVNLGWRHHVCCRLYLFVPQQSTSTWSTPNKHFHYVPTLGAVHPEIISDVWPQLKHVCTHTDTHTHTHTTLGIHTCMCACMCECLRVFVW